MQARPDISTLFSSLDIIVFIIVILMTIGFILYGHHKHKHSDSDEENYLELMLMGRQLTLPLFVMTLVATWYGGIFGVSQMAFDYGIFNFLSQGVFWYATYIIFALFMIPRIAKYEAMTLPELTGKMFGEKSRSLAAVMNILNLVPIVYVISLGLLIEMIFGLSFQLSMIIGVSFVTLYSLFGGFRAVVFSDLFQFFIMVTAVIFVCIYSVTKLGVEPLKTLPNTYFHPLGKFTLTETLVWGLIALSTLVDPNFYQRCFAAESPRVAKKGILLATVIWCVFDLSLTFGAIYAKTQIPEAPSEYGYFYYALQILPEGFRGFFLAGITATILSTLDSYLFLAGSTFAHDLIPSSLKNKFKIHHISLMAVAILSLIMANSFEGNIKAVWKTLGSLSSCALLVPMVFGMLFPGRLTDNQFFLTSMSGAIVAFVWRYFDFKQTYQLDEIYPGMFITIVIILLIQVYKISSSKA
ncbi:MAG: sodium:phosphate symporter [Halobacteriovoraceae bacterium]|nr:sodium:phosphate symporter [Halobacteriovoraceae bacterium]|tara:strand:+ start:739 stop:2142 length:1404 start_codon:yes stop_codon:yes gene_type:complete